MEKRELRELIACRKQQYTSEQRRGWSECLWQQIESYPLFRQAQTVLIYHSLPDEIQTHDFIRKWGWKKQFLLPVVKGKELDLHLYEGEGSLRKGSYGIAEPSGNGVWNRMDDIQLAFIPGMAFDVQGHRLGRGKGYYDRLLPYIAAPKIGICFQFQIMDRIPVTPLDYPMDEVWTEEGLVFSKR